MLLGGLGRSGGNRGLGLWCRCRRRRRRPSRLLWRLLSIALLPPCLWLVRPGPLLLRPSALLLIGSRRCWLLGPGLLILLGLMWRHQLLLWLGRGVARPLLLGAKAPWPGHVPFLAAGRPATTCEITAARTIMRRSFRLAKLVPAQAALLPPPSVTCRLVHFALPCRPDRPTSPLQLMDQGQKVVLLIQGARAAATTALPAAGQPCRRRPAAAQPSTAQAVGR